MNSGGRQGFTAAGQAPPLLSVVTVVRNGVGTLARTIESVLAEGERIEYLVIDGGAVDRPHQCR